MKCICCEGSLRRLSYKDQFKHNYLLECLDCQHIQLEQIPSQEEIVKYYEQSYTSDRGKHLSEAYFTIMNKRANAQLSLIRDYIDIEGSTIVDLGCGFGNFLSAIKGYCNKSYGLEYDDLAIKHCKQQELDVRKIHDESEIANIDPCKLVVLSHVLEHLRSIDTTLESLKSSSEYVFIEIPSYNRSIAEQYVDQEGHLNFFTKKSASMLFDKLGFEIIHLDSYGPNIKLFWKENWFFNIIKRQFRSASKDFFMNKYHSKSNNGIWIRSILKVKSNH